MTSSKINKEDPFGLEFQSTIIFIAGNGQSEMLCHYSFGGKLTRLAADHNGDYNEMSDLVTSGFCEVRLTFRELKEQQQNNIVSQLTELNYEVIN